MLKREEMDDLFRCLFAGISTRTEQSDAAQSQQLLSAFDRINDHRLRRELVLLVEIIAQMPELLERRRDHWDHGAVAQIH